MTSPHEWKRMLGCIFAGTINQTLASVDEEFGGCRVINCGPCAALKWFEENADGFVDDCLKLAYPEGNWSWQRKDERGGTTVDWAHLQAVWDSHKGCSYGPEEGWRCGFED